MFQILNTAFDWDTVWANVALASRNPDQQQIQSCNGLMMMIQHFVDQHQQLMMINDDG